MLHSLARRRRGFTLIELLVVVALIAIVLAIGVPSFNRFIVQNRLKAITAQMVSDLQFARSEAATRNTKVYWTMGVVQSPTPMSCYTIYTTTNPASSCNCGSTTPCTSADVTELKTVKVPSSLSVGVYSELPSFAFDSINGGIVYGTSDYTSTTPTTYEITSEIGTTQHLKTTVSPAGRPTVCTFSTARLAGYPTC